MNLDLLLEGMYVREIQVKKIECKKERVERK